MKEMHPKQLSLRNYV